MNDARRTELLSLLRKIDEVLAGVCHRVDPVETDRLFPASHPDAAPVQGRLVADHARDLRAAMRASLNRLGIAIPQSTLSSVQSARVGLIEAQRTLAGLDPFLGATRGEVSGDEARELRALASDLSARLDAMDAYLAQGGNAARPARLMRLRPLLTTGALFAEIERIVDIYDLGAFRRRVSMLGARLDAPLLEVAAFGRVKAGKSALLNRILGWHVLPVGVMPVTAVPVRIVQGATPIGHAEFADAVPETFDLGRMAEFVSAQQNPGNARHATSLEISLPVDLLSAGVVLVDTPGVNHPESLSGGDTTACLERCDIGLVLIDAASTLTDADVSLIDDLLHAGAQVQVLLAKADLLDAANRGRALDFIHRRLLDQIGLELPVYPVSSRDVEREWTDQWLAKEMHPRFADARALAARSLSAKLSLLRDAVRTALTRRLSAVEGAPSTEDLRLRQAARLSADVTASFDEARAVAPKELVELPEVAEQALDEAAHNAAVLWTEHRTREFDATPLIEASVQSKGGLAGAAVGRQLADMRAMALMALADLNLLLHKTLPHASPMPVVDATGAIPLFKMLIPFAAGLAGEHALKCAVRHEMRERGLDRRTCDLLHDYAARLEMWRAATLDEWKAAFQAIASAAMAEDDQPDRSDSAVAADLRKLDGV